MPSGPGPPGSLPCPPHSRCPSRPSRSRCSAALWRRSAAPRARRALSDWRPLLSVKSAPSRYWPALGTPSPKHGGSGGGGSRRVPSRTRSGSLGIPGLSPWVVGKDQHRAELALPAATRDSRGTLGVVVPPLAAAPPRTRKCARPQAEAALRWRRLLRGARWPSPCGCGTSFRPSTRWTRCETRRAAVPGGREAPGGGGGGDTGGQLGRGREVPRQRRWGAL